MPVLILRGLFARRAQLAEFLSSNPSLTKHRYFRLMALSMTEMLFTVPIATFGMFLSLTRHDVRPWISWSDTHYNYSHVNLYPSILWRMDHLTTVTVEISRALPVVCAVVFFAFFGFAEEARRHYGQTYTQLFILLRLRPKPSRYVL